MKYEVEDGIVLNINIEEHDSKSAAAALKTSAGNRRLREDHIARQKRSMGAGVFFSMNGQTVVFDEYDRLADAHHRFTSLAETPGVKLPFLVVRGVPVEWLDSIDQDGAPRSIEDALAWMGESNVGALASIIRAVWSWQHSELDRESGRSTPSVHEAKQILVLYPELRDAAAEGLRIAALGDGRERGEKAGSHIGPAPAGFLFWRFSQIDAGEAKEFFESLKMLTGSELDFQLAAPLFNSPVLALYTALRDEYIRTKGSGESSRVRRYAFTIKAWNAFRRNEPMGQRDLTWRLGRDNRYEAFPEPI